MRRSSWWTEPITKRGKALKADREARDESLWQQAERQQQERKASKAEAKRAAEAPGGDDPKTFVLEAEPSES
jgi:hypothetical protein